MAMRVRVNSGSESQPPNELPMSVDPGMNIAGALVSPSSQLAPDAPAGAVRRFFYVDGAMGRPLSGDTTGPLQVRQPVEGSMPRVATAVSREQYVFPDVLAADAVSQQVVQYPVNMQLVFVIQTEPRNQIYPPQLLIT